MINSYELHQLRSIGNTSSIHHALVFLPNMLAFSYPDHCQISYIEPLLSRQLLLPSFLPKNLSCISSVRSIFQELLVLYDTRPSGWQLLLKNNLYHILVICFRKICCSLHPQTVPYRHEKINTSRFSAIFRNITTEKSIWRTWLLPWI